MVQTVTISGRLGADAEQRQAGNDMVTGFNMAVDQGYGERKVTNWFRVSIWGKKGSGAAPYLLKSGVVTVVGELEIGEFNGKPQYNVRAYDFTLPAKQGGQQDRQQSRSQSGGFGGGNQSGGFSADLDDETPF